MQHASNMAASRRAGESSSHGLSGGVPGWEALARRLARQAPHYWQGELDDQDNSYAFGVTAWIQERLDKYIDALLAAAAPGSGEEEV